MWECLKIRANKSLKQTIKPRRKRNYFFSYVLGDQIKIDSVNSKLSETLQIYNQDFKSISKFNTLLKFNLNRLSTQMNIMTLVGKSMQDNLIISSALTRKDPERLSHTINILSHLSRLVNVIVQSGMNNLLIELQSALMNKQTNCVFDEENRCLVNLYLTISSDKQLQLHKTLKTLIKHVYFKIVCEPLKIRHFIMGTP